MLGLPSDFFEFLSWVICGILAFPWRVLKWFTRKVIRVVKWFIRMVIRLILISVMVSVVYYAYYKYKTSLRGYHRLSLGLANLSECEREMFMEAEMYGHAYGQCLLDRLGQDKVEVWNGLQPAIEHCLARTSFWKQLDVLHFGKQSGQNQSEKHRRSRPNELDRHYSRFLIMPASKKEDCVVVIVRQRLFNHEKGSTDSKLFRLLHKCEFHIGSQFHDPNLHPDVKYHHMILSDGPAMAFQVYTQHTSIRSFLQYQVKKPQIDYLWIDDVTRGPVAFDVLPWGKTFGRTLPILPIYNLMEYSLFTNQLSATVCQIVIATKIYHVEISGFDMDRVAAFILKHLIMPVISESPFLPFGSELLIEESTLLQFYVNVASPYCLHKYFISKVCAKEIHRRSHSHSEL